MADLQRWQRKSFCCVLGRRTIPELEFDQALGW